MKKDKLNNELESLEDKVDLVSIRMNAAFDRLDDSRNKVERTIHGLYILIIASIIVDVVSNYV